MSDTVSVKNMKIQATADSGIIIRNELTDTWASSVNASYDGASAAVLPTSTANTSTWYYRMSSQFDDEEGDQVNTAYTPLTSLTDVQEGVSGDAADGVYGVTTNSVTQNYYLLNKFYIKSSGQALTDKNVTVKAVKATAPENAVSTALNRSLRVAVKIGNDVFIYAPFNETAANLTYHVGGYTGEESSPTWANTVTAVKPGENGVLATPSVADDATIPANTATINGAGDTPTAIEADVFLYFEGEDPDCKSSNIKATFDQLNVELSFGFANTNSQQQGG